jgi:hypothetical protein
VKEARHVAASSRTDPAPDLTTPSLAELLSDAQSRPGSDLDKLPRRLSPSRASDFVQCPQKFYYKTICKLSEPQSVQTVRGTLVHEACERIFDHPEGQRTPELAIGYLRPAWAQMTDPDHNPDGHPDGSEERVRDIERARSYLEAVPAGSELEAEMFAFAETQVRNWFEMERVNNFSPTTVMMPDGSVVDGRELHVSHDLSGEVNVHG